MNDRSGGPSSEATLTKFFIFIPDEDRRVWRFVGTVVARDRKHAARLHFGEFTERLEYSAVSENAWKPTWKEPPPPTSGALEMPDVSGPAGQASLAEAGA